MLLALHRTLQQYGYGLSYSHNNKIEFPLRIFVAVLCDGAVLHYTFKIDQRTLFHKSKHAMRITYYTYCETTNAVDLSFTRNDWIPDLIAFFNAFRQNIEQEKAEIQARIVAFIGSMRRLRHNKPCRDMINMISQMIYKMEADRVRRT